MNTSESIFYQLLMASAKRQINIINNDINDLKLEAEKLKGGIIESLSLPISDSTYVSEDGTIIKYYHTPGSNSYWPGGLRIIATGEGFSSNRISENFSVNSIEVSFYKEEFEDKWDQPILSLRADMSLAVQDGWFSDFSIDSLTATRDGLQIILDAQFNRQTQELDILYEKDIFNYLPADFDDLISFAASPIEYLDISRSSDIRRVFVLPSSDPSDERQILLIFDGSSFSDTDSSFTVDQLSYLVQDLQGNSIAELIINADISIIDGRLQGDLLFSKAYANANGVEITFSKQLSLLEDDFGTQLALFDSVREAWTSFLTSPIEFLDMARSGDTRRVFVLPPAMTGADGDITLIVDGSSFSDTDQTFTVGRLSYQIHDTHGQSLTETIIDVDFDVINGRLIGELVISDIYARVGDSELRVSDQLSLLEEEFGTQLALFDSVREAWPSFLTSPIEFVDMARSGDTRRVFVLPPAMTGADGDITLIVDGTSFSDADKTFTVSRLSYQIHDIQGQLISEIVRNVHVSYQDGQVSDNLDLSEIFPLRELYDREASGVLEVHGNAWRGGTLNADLLAIDDPDGLIEVGYQWQRSDGVNWINIDQATANIFTIPINLSSQDKSIRVLVSTLDSRGEHSLIPSDPIEVLHNFIQIEVNVHNFSSRAPMTGVSVLVNGDPEYTAVSGNAVFGSDSNAPASVSASISPESSVDTTASQAITLQDAVSILMMIAGHSANVGSAPISRFQSLAADFDGSGTVSLADALGVLRHAVGHHAPNPSWVFIEEGDDTLPSILSPGIPGPVRVEVTPPGPIEVNLIGVLRGDVDGSYGIYGG